jgi:hypothetical protein
MLMTDFSDLSMGIPEFSDRSMGIPEFFDRSMGIPEFSDRSMGISEFFVLLVFCSCVTFSFCNSVIAQSYKKLWPKNSFQTKLQVPKKLVVFT